MVYRRKRRIILFPPAKYLIHFRTQEIRPETQLTLLEKVFRRFRARKINQDCTVAEQQRIKDNATSKSIKISSIAIDVFNPLSPVFINLPVFFLGLQLDWFRMISPAAWSAIRIVR